MATSPAGLAAASGSETLDYNGASLAESEGVGGLRKYEANGVTLILGDSREMKIAADAVISDPPYGQNFRLGRGEGRNPKWKKRHVNVAIMGDDEPFDPAPWLDYPIVVLWGANNYASRLPDRRLWLVWDKYHDIGSSDFADCELAWTNRDAPIRRKKHRWAGVCRESESGEIVRHPTQKPVVLMTWCMAQMKVPQDATVLDPFMGSGTTAIACIRTGRRFIGVEKDVAIFEGAVERIRAELAQGVLSLGGGGGFSFEASDEEPRKSLNARVSDGADNH